MIFSSKTVGLDQIPICTTRFETLFTKSEGSPTFCEIRNFLEVRDWETEVSRWA